MDTVITAEDQDASQALLFGVAPKNQDDSGPNPARSINLDDIFADCFFGNSVESALEGIPGKPNSGFQPQVADFQQHQEQALPLQPPQQHEQQPLFDTHTPQLLVQQMSPPVESNYQNPNQAFSQVDPHGETPLMTDGVDEFDDDLDKKPKRQRPQSRQMTEQQKVERRERNREHAKRSRVRKKFLLESLQQSVNALQQENEKLRSAIKDHLGPQADSLLSKCSENAGSLIASNPSDATRILDDPDYSLVKALQTAQQNFVITDPSLPDNPIVFASQGFLTLTGYNLEQVLGRNCRFLQGPQTDPRAVAKIRKAISVGYDTSVCLLNYRIDGTTFWNQFFVAPLRDSDGNVVNYVGVQCKVSDDFARAIAQSESATPSAETNA
mmetsp:Transcript_59510/g.81313  ORF Transcript_59510/g.81313 Transcript_59510/m.81313 type:complete len:383 (-) Transcript_59510:780-1928(-)|eukprot:CAMPEP_0185770054 /NCGR_PEP_ID=MMETSP1174-20130828/57281_1 /TAXON_ID=35687 /ORGANISM="Dictyocha speculum, Strain CCMP1381" /LENGTH=382 /DNA_ID=CAMNT_0028455349 /DNA_START=134 /DNA_END=1282 /DNA_ORIENTATION=+